MLKRRIVHFFLFLFYLFAGVAVCGAGYYFYHSFIATDEAEILALKERISMASVGDTIKLQVTEQQQENNLHFDVGDNNVVTINQNNELVAVGMGKANIVATSEDGTTQVVTVYVGGKASDLSESSNESSSNGSNSSDSSNPSTDNSSSSEPSSKPSSDSSSSSEPSSKPSSGGSSSSEPSSKPSSGGSSSSKPSSKPSTSTTPSQQPSTVAVQGVSLNTSSAIVYLNQSALSVSLTATVSPSNATNKTVTWTSSDPNVATVSPNGVVTARYPGTAVITVTTNDGHKTANFTMVVKKRYIIVIGASQVVRMRNNVSSYLSSKYCYKTADSSLLYYCKSGSGIGYQIQGGAGWQETVNFLNTYSHLKNYLEYFVFFPLSGNSVKDFACNNIGNNPTIDNYVLSYNNAIQGWKNNGFNVKGYVVSMQPLVVGQRGNNTNIVVNQNANACKVGYRSNRKYYRFNVRVNHLINDGNRYTANLKYLSLFTQIMQVNNEGDNYSFKSGWKDYSTTDGMHWDPATASKYTKFMFDNATDL